MPGPPYRKTVPGADCVYQPDDLHLYADDAWDVRISVGDQPLDEAFYLTIEDPGETSLTIQQVLARYALNHERRDQLDVADYPELPYLQEELIQYWAAYQANTQRLQIHVNNGPRRTPVNAYDRAESHLSVCTYHDGSWDYRVLDLVFVPEPAPLPAIATSDWQASLAPDFALLALARETANPDSGTRRLTLDPRSRAIMQTLQANGLVDEQADGWHATEAGLAAATELALETDAVRAQFEPYASVSVFPPALGVPGGMDARVQMIRYAGLPVERTTMLLLLDAEPDWLADDWLGKLQSGDFFRRLWEVLAYETHFSDDVLAALQQLPS